MSLLSRFKDLTVKVKVPHPGTNRRQRRAAMKDDPGLAKRKPRNWRKKRKARRKMAQASRKRNR